MFKFRLKLYSGILARNLARNILYDMKNALEFSKKGIDIKINENKNLLSSIFTVSGIIDETEINNLERWAKQFN